MKDTLKSLIRDVLNIPPSKLNPNVKAEDIPKAVEGTLRFLLERGEISKEEAKTLLAEALQYEERVLKERGF